jgi:hypothetical protein
MAKCAARGLILQQALPPAAIMLPEDMPIAGSK